jgi:hypothetical protein
MSQYRETMLAWEEPARWAYRVDESTDPVAHALVEDWSFHDHGDRTTVRWVFAIDPGPAIGDALPAAEKVIGDVFREAMANLSARLSRTARP